MTLLERWTGKAHLAAQDTSADPVEAAEVGRRLLTGPAEAIEGLEVRGENIEHSNRPVVIEKVHRGYQAYRQMLHYYAVRNLLDYAEANAHANLAAVTEALDGPRQTRWVNLGGQLIPAEDLQQLIADITSGELDSWADIHQRYDRLWAEYPLTKQRHAMAALCDLLDIETLTPERWAAALDEAVETQRYVCEQTYLSRKKDYDNPFRQVTFANPAEMEAVMGSPESVSFVKQVRRETDAFTARVAAIKSRG